MKSLNGDGTLPEQTVYFALLTGLCGLDTKNNERDKQLANDYLRPAVKKLNKIIHRKSVLPEHQNSGNTVRPLEIDVRKISIV